MGQIYNISSSRCLVDELAERFLREYSDNPLALADILFLLPNRRACKSLADAFVRQQGMQPTLLPQMMPIGDVEEDELILSGTEIETAWSDLSPAIGRNERLMLFIKIIMAKPKEFGLEKMSLNQACFLAQELANLIDVVNNEGLDFANLTNLVPEEYSAHWQETLKFLSIITEYWPQILNERGWADPSLRKNQLLEMQAEIWRKNPPKRKIVAAGTTATFPAMKKLVKVILDLPSGEVILAGLDKNLDKASWDEVDETHPQFELKELLEYLQVEREEVENLLPPKNFERELMVSEIMRPAKTTDKWREIRSGQFGIEALSGLTMVDCADMRQEALAIALMMRETLEYPQKTAALVTPDRNLARRVATELERWDIKVDDSAGKPLSLTPVGIFLRLVAKICQGNFRRLDFLSLMKHPLAANGQAYSEIRKKVRSLEQKVWRGQKEDEEVELIIAEVKKTLGDLCELYADKKANLKELIRRHIKVAEALAATDKQAGEQILWRGEAGEAAALFVADFYDKAEVLGEVEVGEYLGLLEAMMSKIVVRPKFGTHPRLKILGPIEARLNHFDVMIIGGINEGIWPQAPGSDPWMSRPMKKDFGFPLPEKAIGVMALDFCSLLGGREVYLSRSERVQGTPMVKSRWWMRLETVLKAAGIKTASLQDVLYKIIAKHFDEPEKTEKINPPAPRPPVEARPRTLSASAIEMWMRDPYAIFAKYILKLKPLEDIEPDLTMADYGTIIHGILEQFNNKHRHEFPQSAKEELLALGREYFKADALARERLVFWWPSFERIVDWLVEKESEYRQEIAEVSNEVSGEFSFEAPAGRFTVTAKADRVDMTKDGKINIIDYKTGKARSIKEVKSGYAPQLPIEGIIASEGGFGSLPPREIDKLIYWQLGRKETEVSGEMSELLANTKQRLQDLAALFDFETTAYVCQPNPHKIPEYSDYEHLARVKEWSVATGGESND